MSLVAGGLSNVEDLSSALSALGKYVGTSILGKLNKLVSRVCFASLKNELFVRSSNSPLCFLSLALHLNVVLLHKAMHTAWRKCHVSTLDTKLLQYCSP